LSTDGILVPALQESFQNVITISNFINGVLGDWRHCSLFVNVENSPRVAAIKVLGALHDAPNDGTALAMFSHSAEKGVETTVMLTYDGTDGSAGTDTTPLSVDLSNSNNLRIKYSQSQFQVDGTAKLTDSDGDSASLPFILAAGINSPIETNIPLANFVAQNNDLDLEFIEEIKLTFETTTDATDYILDLIDINMLTDPDSDGDGVPDSQDICPNFDDNIDTDRDGIPDGCDENPTLACGPGTTLEGFMCMCTQAIGGIMIPTETISLLAAGIGVDPLITGLLLVSMVGISLQVGWLLHKRKESR